LIHENEFGAWRKADVRKPPIHARFQE